MADKEEKATELQKGLKKTKREGVPSAGKKNWDDLISAAGFGVKKAAEKEEKKKQAEGTAE